ncbi:uncharacterized protein LOC101753552 isoform X2 [Anopheles sinensis]|uniref:Uncharacterized protein LOC101753552 isoform X2 n=1 Tax=Anopheles sinensis TaxID=74873 RepID=A0A084WRI0_ANOSI|nr:uncharacterized protein LOC101753552 isoform X2 [Anopheles sinensis]
MTEKAPISLVHDCILAVCLRTFQPNLSTGTNTSSLPSTNHGSAVCWCIASPKVTDGTTAPLNCRKDAYAVGEHISSWQTGSCTEAPCPTVVLDEL